MKIKISKQLWQDCGLKMGWMERDAMAVAKPSPEVAQKMKEQGIYFLQNVFRTMPHTTQKDMHDAISRVVETGAADFFKNLGPKEVVDLPAIYVTKPEDVFEYEGNNYIAIDFTDPHPEPYKKAVTHFNVKYPAGSTYPGHAKCLNIDTGEVVPILLPEISSKISPPTQAREETLKKLNTEVASYNEKINAIDKSLGVNRFGMQIVSAEQKIEERLSALEGIKAATLAKMEKAKTDPLAAYKLWEDELKEGLANGKYSPKDIFDTLLFLYQGNPSALAEGLRTNQINVPEGIKAGLLAAAEQAGKSQQAHKTKKEEDRRMEEERIKAKEIPADIHEEPLQPFGLEEVPGGGFDKADEAKTMYHWIGSFKNTLESTDRDIKELTEIKNTFGGLRKYLGTLVSPEMSKAFLGTSEGKTVLSELNSFLTKSEMFIKRYATDIIQNGKVNPQLMGRKGTMGNALLAVSLTKLYNVIKKTIESSLGEPIPPEKVEPGIPMPISSKKEFITKLSNVLWEAFQRRFKGLNENI